MYPGPDSNGPTFQLNLLIILRAFFESPGSWIRVTPKNALMIQFFINTSDSITSDQPIFVGSLSNPYNVRPPSYKLVYKPHEYYSYKYHKP